MVIDDDDDKPCLVCYVLFVPFFSVFVNGDKTINSCQMMAKHFSCTVCSHYITLAVKL